MKSSEIARKQKKGEKKLGIARIQEKSREKLGNQVNTEERRRIQQMAEKYISVAQYAEKTGMNKYYIRKMCRSGEIQGVIRSEFGFRIPISQIRAKKTPTRKYYKITVETVRKLQQSGDIDAFLTEIGAI